MNRYITYYSADTSQPTNWTGFQVDTSQLFYIINNSTHKMTDMLIDCKWRGEEPCNANDFEPVMTDWGLCYSYNNPPNRSDTLKVNQPGSKNGLFLRLHAQQEEYISWENSGAGFKVTETETSLKKKLDKFMQRRYAHTMYFINVFWYFVINVYFEFRTHFKKCCRLEP